MSATSTLVLTPVVLEMVGLGLTVAQEIVAAAQNEVTLVNGGGVPSAAEQAAIDAALDAAHAALQTASS